MSGAEKMARLRALGQDCKLLMLQAHQLVERRNGLALELIDEGHNWREVAEAAGFENPYIAALLKKREASQSRPAGKGGAGAG